MTAALLAGLLAGYGIAVPVGAVGTYLVSLTARTSLRTGGGALLGRALTGHRGRLVTALVASGVMTALAVRMMTAHVQSSESGSLFRQLARRSRISSAVFVRSWGLGSVLKSGIAARYSGSTHTKGA